MKFLEEMEKQFRLLNEKVDRISDKEAADDFNDLDDKDINNDGEVDKNDKYLKKKLSTVALKTENALGVKEPFYVEISVRDARKAVDAIQDDTLLRKALRNKTIIPYGTNVFATDDEELIQTLSDVLSNNGIELTSHQGLDEESGTGNVPGYQTPFSFGKADKNTLKQGGLTPAKKTNKIFKPIWNENKSTYKKMMSEMYGVKSVKEAVSYRDYKKDPTSTPAQKVNNGIAEVNKMLGEMEKIVHNNLRLKTEMGVDSSHFWKNTSARFSKINERIVRLSNKLKELSQ
jgi:hypothetical protein